MFARTSHWPAAIPEANPLRFFVLPGHEDPQIEQVVLRTPTYLVVEKVGEAAREILDQDSGAPTQG